MTVRCMRRQMQASLLAESPAAAPAPKRKAAAAAVSAAAQERRQQQVGELAGRELQREALGRIRLELEEVRPRPVAPPHHPHLPLLLVHRASAGQPGLSPLKGSRTCQFQK